ncbi:MAG: cytochrome P450 [Steroidobacteraceae bacterium]
MANQQRAADPTLDRSYDPLDPVVKHEPYPFYKKLRRDEPVKWLPGLNAFGIARYDDIVRVLQDGRLFSSTQFWPALLGEFDPMPEEPPMISMDPPGHVNLRRLANSAFVPANVNKLQRRAGEIAQSLVDDIIKKHGPEGEFDWVWDFTSLFPVTIIAEILGVPTQRRAEFKVWVDDILSAANRAGYDAPRLAKIRTSSDKMRAFFEELFNARANAPGDDMMTKLMEAEVDGQRLTRNEVMSMSILLLIGGVETTTNLLGTTLVEMKRHPDVYARVRQNPALVPSLLEEVLRYNPPVQILFRHSTAATQIGGVDIPAGSTIMPILASANRDETKYSNPDVFDIDRRPEVPILSFGQGPHFCLGNYLTRMEAKLALQVMFQRFAVLEAVSDEVEWIDSYFARGPHHLRVRFKVAA